MKTDWLANIHIQIIWNGTAIFSSKVAWKEWTKRRPTTLETSQLIVKKIIFNIYWGTWLKKNICTSD